MAPNFERAELEAVRARLRGRRREIEQLAHTRAHSISHDQKLDPTYFDGLRTAVSAAVEYGLSALEATANQNPPVPVVLVAQARLAARSGVSLDTVLRRYCAGHVLFTDFLIEEAETVDLPRRELKLLLRSLAAAFDRLLATVGEDYSREADSRPTSSDQRLLQRVKRLLSGEPQDTSDLNYDFEAQHLGAVISGADAEGAARNLAAPLDCRLLLVKPDEQTAWVWFGGRRAPDPGDLQDLVSSSRPDQHHVALGEPGDRIEGWRLSHRQAAATLLVARRTDKRNVRYADVALLAAMLQDDLLATSLRQIYLEPLRRDPDNGETLISTLTAYFHSGQNLSSAASVLEVSRRTVANRIRGVEARLGRPIHECAVELEATLRLAALEKGYELTRAHTEKYRPLD